MLPEFIIPNSIVQILNQYLLDDQVGINEAYSSLLINAGAQQHFSYRFDIVKLRDPFHKLLNSYSIPPTTNAIDLPVMLGSSNNKPTIIVCAMDSLPPEPNSHHWAKNGISPNDGIQLWIPFSLCEPWNSPKGSMTSNLNFFKPLIESFNVYVTDIYKLFFRIFSNGIYLRSNQIQDYQNLVWGENGSIHKQILKNEIEVLKPAAIVTLGSAATHKLFDLSEAKKGISSKSTSNLIPAFQTPFGIPHYPMPHISNAANGAKALFIKQLKILRKNGESPNTVIANHLIHSINNS